MILPANQGLLMCSRYAFSPNKLKYCGPDENTTLFEYCQKKETDGGLAEMLTEFETLYPYLRLIAHANRESDVFSPAVVEAYWIGNTFLDNVEMQKLNEHLEEALHLKKKIPSAMMQKLVGKIPLGAIPHHNFHVFNVWQRTGHVETQHTLSSMDNCRITVGKVIEKKVQTSGLPLVTIQYKPLNFVGGKLGLGEPVELNINYKEGWTGFVDNLEIGDLVSLHWGWICEKLTEEQARRLNFYTEKCLALANLSYCL